MARLTDTSAEAERLLRENSRRMPIEKMRQMAALYRTARTVNARQVGAHPGRPSTPEDRWRQTMQRIHGKSCGTTV